MSERRLDVALIAAGGPQDLNDIAGFLERSSGAAPDPATLRAAAERYSRVGAPSPALDVTARQATALEAHLRELGVAARVRHGFLASRPSVAECLAELDGEHVVVVSLDPLAPRRAINRVRAVLAAAEATEHGGRGRDLTILDAWGSDRGFARATSRRIAESLDGSVASEWALLFVARGQPLAEIDEGDPLVDQLQQLVAQVLPTASPGRWDLAFLGPGRAGRWLGPAPDDVAREQLKEGWSKVLVVPLGFVADDVATLFDLDVVLRQRVNDLGMKYRRARVQNDSPTFITAIADIITHHVALQPASHAQSHPHDEVPAAPQA